MSYAALLTRSVALAFRAVGDLASPAVLTKTGTRSFNFDTMLPVIAPTQPLPVYAIVTEEKKKDGTKLSLMMELRRAGDINLYDTITINNANYLLVRPITRYGAVYVCTVEEKK